MPSYAWGGGGLAVDFLYYVAAYNMNSCGDDTPSNATVNRYLLDRYFCGIKCLRLMILDPVLLGHWVRFWSDAGPLLYLILQLFR